MRRAVVNRSPLYPVSLTQCNSSQPAEWSKPFSTLYSSASPTNLKWGNKKKNTTQTRNSEGRKVMKVLLQSCLTISTKTCLMWYSPALNSDHCRQERKRINHDSKGDSSYEKVNLWLPEREICHIPFFDITECLEETLQQQEFGVWLHLASVKPKTNELGSGTWDLFNRTLYLFNYFLNYEIIHTTVFPSSRSS